jgi:hypothetical protein
VTAAAVRYWLARLIVFQESISGLLAASCSSLVRLSRSLDHLLGHLGTLLSTSPSLQTVRGDISRCESVKTLENPMMSNQDDSVAAIHNSRTRRLLTFVKNSFRTLIPPATRRKTKCWGSESPSPDTTGHEFSRQNASSIQSDGSCRSQTQYGANHHSPGHSSESESDLSDLLPHSLLDFVSSTTQPQTLLKSTLFIQKSPQEPSSNNMPEMPEMLITGHPSGNVSIAHGIDRLDSFRLAKFPGYSAHRLSTQNLHGSFQIYSHDPTERPIVGASQ